MQIVLAERGVLYPGKAKIVVHRMVARGVLTEELDGAPYAPINGVMSLKFDKSLTEITEENEAFLKRHEDEGRGLPTRLSTSIDPQQVSLVAIVRDGNTVLQAVQITPEGAESNKN